MPVQMLHGRMEPRCRCSSSTLRSAPADSEVLNRTLGYVRVPAFHGSDCSSVVGYAHNTLWSTPVQFSGARACCVSTHGTPGGLEYSRVRSMPGVERRPRADKEVHRRHRTLTIRRRSTVEASRFFAVTSTTSAAAAALRLIAASCAHPIFGRSAQFLFSRRETL